MLPILMFILGLAMEPLLISLMPRIRAWYEKEIELTHSVRDGWLRAMEALEKLKVEKKAKFLCEKCHQSIL